MDGLNQIYSSTFGILAFGHYITYRDRGRAGFYCLYVGFCLLAALAKENGLVWFPVIPFLYATCRMGTVRDQVSDLPQGSRQDLGRASRDALVGLGFCMLYFGVRFVLSGSVSLGAAEGPYVVSLSAQTVVKFLTLVAGAFTVIDTVALFSLPRQWFLLGVTTLLTLPFLLWLAVGGVRALRTRGLRWALIALLLSAGAMSLPNSLTTVGEMHAYLLMFFVALLIGLLIRRHVYGRRSVLLAVCLAAAVATGITSTHKWQCLKRQGQRTAVVNDAIEKAYQGMRPPDRVLIIKVMDEPPGYSLFLQPVAFSSYYGYSARSLWGWRHPVSIRDVAIKHLAEKDEAIAKALSGDDGYDAIWVVRANGDYYCDHEVDRTEESKRERVLRLRSGSQ